MLSMLNNMRLLVRYLNKLQLQNYWIPFQKLQYFEISNHHSIRISYAPPIKHRCTVISSADRLLNRTKPFKRIIFPPFTMSICNIYEQQTSYVLYHSLNACGILSASFKPPLNSSHPLPLKTERGKKNKVHGTSVHR